MVRKKKIEEPEEEFIEDEIESDNDYDDDLDETTIDSSLEIGGQIHTQSDVISKNFMHLPKDVKYSKFANMDIANFLHKSKTYQLWNYINKCTYISKFELKKVKEERKEIYDIKTPNDLKEYLEKIGKVYIWYSLLDLSEKDFEINFKNMLEQLENTKNEGITNLMYRERTVFLDAYKEYTNKHKKAENIDDFGLMNGMMTLTEVKKAKDGWGMGSMNTTINVTREENPKDKAEENPEDSETKSFLSKFKK